MGRLRDPSWEPSEGVDEAMSSVWKRVIGGKDRTGELPSVSGGDGIAT